MKIFIQIFDYFKAHKFLCRSILVIITLLLVMKMLTISFKEDISDFLPLDSTHHKALTVFQDISSSNKIFILFQYRDSLQSDPDSLISAINIFSDKLLENDSTNMVKELTTKIDAEKIFEVSDFVYNNIPYFLTDADYQRIDSIMSSDNAIDERIEQDKQMLMFPTGSMLSANIQRDPLNIFTPTVMKLSNNSPGIKYETYDGYIFSPDMKRAIVMLSSPFGSSETENNSKLIELISNCLVPVTSSNSNIDTSIIGGPAIAVTNATQIKHDSILAVIIAVVLILILLIFSFKSFVSIFLILLSVGWGWLFAIGGMALFYDSVSIIVIGIASVILGIAVNYPLHFIAHLGHQHNIRDALKEVVSPLLIGNITTVGAFMSLTPLSAPALRDLGFFSAFMLIGTVLFVLLFLPHIVKQKKVNESKKERLLFGKLSNYSFENKKWIVIVVLCLTAIFGYFSLDTGFDSDMRNINYMTDTQKRDMKYLQTMIQSNSDNDVIYVASEGKNWEEALTKNESIQPLLNRYVSDRIAVSNKAVSVFIPSKAEQKSRIERWNEFVNTHREQLTIKLQQAGRENGFNDSSFDQFYNILSSKYEVKEWDFFNPLSQLVFAGNISASNDTHTIVSILNVPAKNAERVKAVISKVSPDNYCFDVKSMNSAITNSLSADFNYIGWVCGLIVFVFLWLSFGRIELAILSFLPMAISWLWILGIMNLSDIQFNIVNVILATFIFGQGDDYTIFMTEGLSYEYAYRRKLLASYKNSIIISALIMFIGIGSLIFAKHPALQSLADVTVIGMLSVVLMAYLFPPFIFNWIVKNRANYRLHPITLKKIADILFVTSVFFVQLSTVFIVAFALLIIGKRNAKNKLRFHRYICSLFRFDIKRIPGVKYKFRNLYHEDFSKPAVIICNHLSLLDSMCMMILHPKMILVANDNVSTHKVISKIFAWADFFPISHGIDTGMALFREHIENGYSIVIFAEGERGHSGNVLRFHKGAFYLSEQLNVDIIPIYLQGIGNVMPKGQWFYNPGQIMIDIGKRISHTDTSYGNTYVERTKSIHKLYIEHYNALRAEEETATYFKTFVYERYLYKGSDIERNARKLLNNYNCFSKFIDSCADDSPIVIINNGQGEFGLLFALTKRNLQIHAYESDSDLLALSRNCVGVTDNLTIHHTSEITDDVLTNANIYIFKPTTDDKITYGKYNPIYVE